MLNVGIFTSAISTLTEKPAGFFQPYKQLIYGLKNLKVKLDYIGTWKIKTKVQFSPRNGCMPSIK